MFTRRATASLGVLLAALTLAACTVTGSGTGSTDSSNQSAETNAADQGFTMEMIPHHEQAVEMADILLAKSGVDSRVIDLAQQIKSAQGPEIELMKGWLDSWGVGSMDGMDHGGMMSDDDMAALESASGAEASALFLSQMIVHHEGAVEMAQMELDNGVNSDVRALAEGIIASQTAEIATMKEILGSL